MLFARFKLIEVILDSICKINDIKIAFRKHEIKWHPVKNNDKDSTIRMQLIAEIYPVLKD